MNDGKADLRGRLAERPAPVVLEHIYQVDLEADLASLPYLTDANLAHAVMLVKQGIINEQDAKALLQVLLDVDRRGIECFELDPALEGLYYNYERHLINELGAHVGGRLHTGRSRNDLGATISRMQLRTAVLELLGSIVRFRRTLISVAEKHLETVMTGYTHLQPAQPITFGHYLAAVEQALQRDTARLCRSFECANKSCMGAGALAGTGFPIDREITADLLGFDGYVVNTLDAVAGRDYLLEFLSSLAILSTTLSRVAQDFYVWYTDEFGLIRFPDRFGGTSSIMPQKKNPIVLESCKGRLSLVFGGLISALSAMKNTSYTNVMDVNRESFRLLDDSKYQAKAAVELLDALIEAVEVQEDRAYDMATSNFCTVTQLADTLVREKEYSFREAHHLVAAVVRTAVERRLRATDITSHLVDEVSIGERGSPVELTEETVQKALNPLENISARSHPGGPAPNAVLNALDQAKDILANDTRYLEMSRDRLEASRARLREAARKILDH